MRILAVVNQKGGVGKTTTTVNLGAALAMSGHRCLVVDLDPQSNLTTSLGLQIAEDGYSVYDVLVDREPLGRAVLDTDVPNLIACPSDPSLAAADLQIAADDPDPQGRALRLRGSLSDYARDDPGAEFVLLDCPPSLGLLTVNALVAASAVVVPMQCEFFAMQGLSRLLDTVTRIGRSWNPGLDLLGVLFTMVDRRTNLARDVIAEVQGKLGDRVFGAIVPRSVRAAEAPSYGVPLQIYDPRSRVAAAYADLAQEIVSR
ncbi:MAG: ParA family protein [Acidobacteriota bacterium]|nr:ParA family protein [Acidobacteriota bacterium]MDE2971826.1 ParA family protein [Acidobacteriota bacterium]MDE3261881.1 ParA family protein [Acidobacteriota bacterium]